MTATTRRILPAVELRQSRSFREMPSVQGKHFPQDRDGQRGLPLFQLVEAALDAGKARAKLHVVGLRFVHVIMQRFNFAGSWIGQRKIVDRSSHRADLLLQNGDRLLEHRDAIGIRPDDPKLDADQINLLAQCRVLLADRCQLLADDGSQFLLGHAPSIAQQSIAYNVRPA